MAKAMKKLVCSVTGDWWYMSEKRYQRMLKKFGSDEGIRKGYVSRKGKMILDGTLKKEDIAPSKNKIICNLTRKECYVSAPRMRELIAKHGSEQEVRETFISRIGMSLRKKFMDEDNLEQEEAEARVKEMADAGDLPEDLFNRNSVLKTNDETETVAETDTKTVAETTETEAETKPEVDEEVDAFLNSDDDIVADEDETPDEDDNTATVGEDEITSDEVVIDDEVSDEDTTEVEDEVEVVV
jgi:hypothetical protein